MREGLGQFVEPAPRIPVTVRAAPGPRGDVPLWRAKENHVSGFGQELGHIRERADFQGEVLESEQPVFIDVSATWCGPCKLAHPIVEELAKTHAGRLKVVEIDGGESPALVARLGVRGFPTFIGVRRQCRRP